MISRAADFGRILGASAVFYFHVGLPTGFSVSAWGEYAVAFFIFLAGIAYVGFSSVKPTDPQSYRRYVYSRIRAIFPIFIAINCAIFAASFVYPSAQGRPFTFAELLLSATGLSQYFQRRYMSLVMWFIPFILQVYLVLPFLERLLERMAGVVVVILAFAVSLLLTSMAFWLWPSNAHEICRNWSVIFRLPEVCFGVIAGRCIFSRENRQAGLVALAAFALISCVLSMAVAPHFDAQSYILSLPWNGLIVSLIIAAAGVIFAAISKNWGGERLIRMVGAASYPFYLAHGVAIAFVFRRFGSAPTVWIVYFVLSWGGAIVLQLLFNNFERAMRRRNSVCD